MTFHIQIPNLTSRGILRATLITLCFVLADDLHINILKFVAAHGRLLQWRTQKTSMGVFIQWHMAVICIWCALFVTSQFDVLFMFSSEVC